MYSFPKGVSESVAHCQYRYSFCSRFSRILATDSRAEESRMTLQVAGRGMQYNTWVWTLIFCHVITAY